MAHVFVFDVEDIDAQTWDAELAVVAEARRGALHRLRSRGVKRRDLRDPHGRPVLELSLAEVSD